MIFNGFRNAQESHEHSLMTLNMLYEHDDFMASVKTLADMGCGEDPRDLEWWATRTTRDLRSPQPLNIRCTGIDVHPKISAVRKHKNISYLGQNFEEQIKTPRKFDVIWCHDSFQYVINPFQTLTNWRESMADDGMLVLILPQTTNIENKTQAFDQRDGAYWHWTLVNLIHVLAVTGWDCRSGFFKKAIDDPWLHAAVYKSKHSPMDPKTTRWYELAEKELLPESAAAGVNKYGYLRQRDLILPWLDKSFASFSDH